MTQHTAALKIKTQLKSNAENEKIAEFKEDQCTENSTGP